MASACFVFAALLAAEDFSGKWTGMLSFGDQQFPLTYVFKQDGAKLTGTVTGPGGDLPLAEGKVDGDKISFSVSWDAGGAPVKVNSQGTMKGEEIVLTSGGENMPSSSLTLKRVK
jgi:hypothetical protein